MTKKIIIYLLVSLMPIFLMMPLALPDDSDSYENHPELISLDLKGMDIRDVLKILSQKSGLNIVADKDVKGTVALYIKDVDVMDALDILVSTNGLAYEQKGALITVMTEREYEKLHGRRFKETTVTEIVKLNYAVATDIAKAVQQMKTKVGKIIADDRSNTILLVDTPENVKRIKEAISEIDGPLVTEIFSLDYAKAESIKEKLEQIVTENVGSIKFDERTNKIIVTDTAKKIDEIKKVVEAFDEKTQEVIIDANIMQVTLSDKYSYGIDWAGVAALSDISLTGDTNLSTGITGANPSTLTIATTGGNYASVVSLLKTFGETNVLSRPRIAVADNEEARILVGSKEVYVTSEVTTTSGGTYHTTDHVQFVDVGVRLLVTPEINKAGYIKLKIKPEVSNTDSTKTVELKNPDGSTRTIVPYVTTSEVETTVIVKDNTTLIIGGLMKDTVVNHTEKVPFLGDLPLVGKLFSTRGKSKEKTELVIFLTPHILEGDATTKEAKKYLIDWEDKQLQSDIERPAETRPKLAKKDEVNQKEDTKVITSVQKQTLQKTKPLTEKKRSIWSKLLGPKEERPKKLHDQPKLQKTPYEEYYLIVRNEVNSAACRQDVSGLKGDVELRFVLDKEGYVTKGPIVLNKPDMGLVRAAINAVKKTMPFPPLPKALNKNEIEFQIIVRYE